MLCGRPAEAAKAVEEEDLMDRRPTLKRKRLTFMLDRALIKLSRKNIGGEEFCAKEQVVGEVEKHLGRRLAGVAMAVFEGRFGEEATNSVFFPLLLLPSAPPPAEFIPHANEIVTQAAFPLRRIAKGVEAYVKWVGAGQEHEEIERTLAKWHPFVEHFVFVCEGDVRMGELHELFVLYREDYMFEVERVMLLDKCVRFVVYVSRSDVFLCIDRGSLIEFCVEEAAKRDAGVEKLELGRLLDGLFEEGLYVEVASVLGDLATSTSCGTWRSAHAKRSASGASAGSAKASAAARSNSVSVIAPAARPASRKLSITRLAPSSCGASSAVLPQTRPLANAPAR